MGPALERSLHLLAEDGIGLGPGKISARDSAAGLPQPRQPLKRALPGLRGAEAEPEHALAEIGELFRCRHHLAPGLWRLVGVEPLGAEHVGVVVQAERVDLARDAVAAALPV